MPTHIRERSTAREAITQTDQAGVIEVTLITPGQGSSGYYSAEVLEAAATSRVFPAGTLMFLDHATETEWYERPERSVRDVGAVLQEDARWTGDSLAAPARLVGPYAATLAEMSDAIGVSISSQATVTEGEIDGARTRIVSQLQPAVDNSIDFVTYPGRGGSFAVLEARRPSRVVESAIRHGVVEATANDTRQALQTALADRFGGEKVWVWVRDFDEANVWYEVETPDSDDVFQLGYSLADSGAANLAAGDPIEVVSRTSYVPVEPADDTTTSTESLEAPVANIQVDEAEHRRLVEASRRTQDAEDRARAAEAERDAAVQRAAVADAREAVRPVAAAVMGASESLSPSTQARVAAECVARLQVPDNGTVDESAFRAACETARTAAEAEIAEYRVSEGAGQPRWLGGVKDGEESAEVTREQSDASRHRAFGYTKKIGA